MADWIELRNMGFDPNIIDHITEILDISEESSIEKAHHAPSRAYIRERRAIAATPADVKEYPHAYVFVIDVPGLKSDQLKVQVDHDTLVVGGERKREKEKEAGVKYIRMERRLGKYLKKFTLPENADTDKISAVCQHGVLTHS